MEYKKIITKDDCYMFGQGTHYEIYNKLGGERGQAALSFDCLE